MANAFLGILMLVLGLVTVLTFVFADGWVYLIAAGFAASPDKFALSAKLTRILSPFLASVSLASLFMGMLNVRGKFFLPAIAPATFNVAVILGCLLAAPFEDWSGQPAIVAVGIASLVGGFGQFAVQIPALYRDGYHIRPNLKGHPALTRLLKFFIPAFIGIMTVQFALLVESQIASRFGDGPVSHLLYAFRLVQLPNAIVAASVGTAALAGLSTLAASGRRRDLPGALAEAFTLNSFLVLPSAIGLYILAEPLVALMYERGAFTPADSQATAAILKMYAIATWGICFHRVALPSYYAIGHPYYPMGIAILTMAAKVPVAVVLVYSLNLGVVGLPLSHAILVMVESALLWRGFKSRIGPLPGRIYTDHLRMLVASALMAASTIFMRPWAEGFMVAPVVMAAGVLYFASSHLLGLDAPGKVISRMLPWRPRGLPPSVDAQTRAALSLLKTAAVVSLELSDKIAFVESDKGRFTVRARDGQLFLENDPDIATPGGERMKVTAVMLLGKGPPVLHGIVLGGYNLLASADRVQEGMAEGPRIPV